MKPQFLILAMLATGLAASPAVACMDFVASPITVTYDPFDPAAASGVVRAITMQATRREAAGGHVTHLRGQFVDRDPDAVPRVGRHGPTYEIEWTAGGRDVLANEIGAVLQPNRSFSTTFQDPPRGRPFDITVPLEGLQLQLHGGQNLAAGVYVEQLDVRHECTYQNERMSGSLTDAAVLTVRIEVPNKISVSIGGASRYGVIDFRQFQENRRETMVLVRSTGPYSLVITSERGGRMVLDGQPATPRDNATIAYSLHFDGRPVALGAPARYVRTGVGGVSLPLSATVEDVAENRAGTYRDTLTLTFTPVGL